MGPTGQVETRAAAPPQSSTSATFVLGPEGPSPSRKGSARGRPGVNASKIPARSLGVNGVLPAHAPTLPVTANGVRSQQPSWSSAPQAPAGVQGIASNVATAAVPGLQSTGTSAPAVSGLPLFAVGAADGQPVGFGTPRSSRSRAGKQKAHGTPPLHANPGQMTAPAVPAFSPIALTPMDANTFQTRGPQTGPMETSPMDITPQGSTVTAGAGAANIFSISPLVGSVGASSAQAAAAAPVGANGASISPAPFMNFTRLPSEAAAPVPNFAAAGAPAPTAATAAPVAVSIPAFGAPRSSSAGSGAPTQAAPHPPAATGAPGGPGIGLRFPIQIQIPGAREVQDLFSSAAASASSGGSGLAGSRGTGLPAGTATLAAGQASMPAGGWQAAAAKKAHDASVGSSSLAGGVGGANPGLGGNDCQPAKDNALKLARAASDSSATGNAASAAAASAPVGPVPGATATGPIPGPASAPGAATVAASSAAVPTGPAAAASASIPAAADPALLAAVAEQFEAMARKAREAAAAVAAARANGQEAAPATGVVAEAIPAVPPAILEMMMRPGVTDKAASAATAGAAPDAVPTLAAAVASMIGGIGALKVEDAQSGAPSAGPSGSASTSAGGMGSGPVGTSGASAAAAPAMPFVFGAGSSSGGGGVSTPPKVFGGAAPPPPVVPFVFKAGSPGPASAGGASSSGVHGAGTSAPFAASRSGSSAGSGSFGGMAAPSVPFMFGATPPPTQPAASTGQPSAASAGARSQAGPSPMSTTPMQQPNFQAQPQPTSFNFSAGSSSSAGGGGGTCDRGSGSAASPGLAGVGSHSNRTAFPRTRAKVTPRKSARPTSAPAEGLFAGAAAAGVPAGGAARAAPGVTHSERPAAHSHPHAQQPQPQAQPQQQPVRTGGLLGDGVDTIAAKAVQLKRTADDKKTYGNQKYEQSDFRAAERWYTEAIEVLEQQLQTLPLPREKMQSLFPTLKTEIAVLYSNRSGARLMTNKPQSALEDALRAMALDPKFMRAASRAATCHCRLGDFAAAHRIIDAAMDRCSASSAHYQDMLKKLNEVVELASRSRAVTATAVAAVAAGSREKLQEALDQLTALKDQVAYCDVVAAARAVVSLRLGAFKDCLALVSPHPEVPPQQRAAPWRLWLTVQARYFRGDLQDALTTCRELQLALEAAAASGADSKATQAAEPPPTSPGGTPQSAAAAAAYATSAHVTVPPPAALAELAETIQQQLKLKEEGNAAIKAGRHSEAAELYSRALTLGCSPAFAALLHANRAAAHTGLGQLADAVADCGRARALDPAYYKASVRLASLMMELRRPENAQGLLEPLVKAGAQSGGAGPGPEELAALKERLSEARAAVSWQKTPHHYKLLGLTNTCNEDDVRKAYRRLALKHHPDKAMSAVKVALAVPGAAGAAPYGGPLAGGSELETRVREEAAWLFNFINQANEELSDKARRRKIDQLLDAEQPPYSRYGSSASSNPYGNGFYGAGGSRYGGFSSAYSNFDSFFFHRPASAAAGGAGSRPRAGSGTGTATGGGPYGGYGTYGASRPGGSSAANGASSGAGGGGGAGSRSTGGTAGAGGASRGGASSGTAGGGFGAAGGGAGAYRRGAPSGARPAPAAAGRKWWEGAGDDSEDEDQDSFNF